jgi:hypothetical protein
VPLSLFDIVINSVHDSPLLENHLMHLLEHFV